MLAKKSISALLVFRLVVLLILCFGYLNTSAQHDSDYLKITSPMNSIYCEFGDIDSLVERSFILEFKVDVKNNLVHSLAVLGSIPESCGKFSKNPNYLVGLLNTKGIQWSKLMEKCTTAKRDTISVFLPVIISIIKREPEIGIFFYRDCIIPLFQSHRIINGNSLFLKPYVLLVGKAKY